ELLPRSRLAGIPSVPTIQLDVAQRARESIVIASIQRLRTHALQILLRVPEVRLERGNGRRKQEARAPLRAQQGAGPHYYVVLGLTRIFRRKRATLVIGINITPKRDRKITDVVIAK